MKLASINFTQLENASASKFSGKGIGGAGGIIQKLIPYLYSIAGILLLLYLLFGGFQLMTSRGNPKVVEAAKGKITLALLGFLIVFLSFWIIQAIGLILGIDVIQDIFVG